VTPALLDVTHDLDSESTSDSAERAHTFCSEQSDSATVQMATTEKLVLSFENSVMALALSDSGPPSESALSVMQLSSTR